jgi:hypothetical protein
MAVTVHICDETTTGIKLGDLSLEFPEERITVRELIRSRVHQEVKDHNVRQNQTVFHGLVQPTDAEQQLNAFRLREPRQIDWEKQYAAALDAFGRNGFLILVDDLQVTELEQEIVLRSDTQITFLKLVALVGG